MPIVRSAKEAFVAIFKQAQSWFPGRRRRPLATPDADAKEQKRLLTELMLERSKNETRFVASFSQQSLWLLNQFDPLSSAYNLQIGLRLTGPLNVEALKLSLQEIVNRHGALRTKFAFEDAQLFQIVVPHFTVSLPLEDLSSLDDASRQARAYQSACQETQLRFDLSRVPLFRFKLIRLASDDHVLNCVIDHIVSDGWSLGIWVRELTRLYAAHSTGEESTLAPLPVQYADYAQWQRESIAGGSSEHQIGYWKKRLRGAPALFELPMGRKRPPQQTFVGSSQWLPVSIDVIRALKSLSAERDGTLFMIALAAFQCLLSRYSGREDILVGVPVAGRNRWETEEIIGLFVNTIVMRTDLSGDPRFRDLLDRVRTVAVEGFCNADLPFVTLIEELKPPRNASHNPVFQVMFGVIKSAVQSNTCAALHVTPYIVVTGTSPLDLTMNLIECANEQWLVQIDYKTSLFDHELITRLIGDYVSSLQSIVSQPDVRLSELGIHHATST